MKNIWRGGEKYIQSIVILTAVLNFGGLGLWVAGGDSSSLMAAWEMVDSSPLDSGYWLPASLLDSWGG